MGISVSNLYSGFGNGRQEKDADELDHFTDVLRTPPATPKMKKLFDRIEMFYNQRRRHSALGQISPS
jgi:hypothetical protein